MMKYQPIPENTKLHKPELIRRYNKLVEKYNQADDLNFALAEELNDKSVVEEASRDSKAGWFIVGLFIGLALGVLF